VYIACIGIASEKPDAQALIQMAQNGRVIDLTGSTTLRELVMLFNISSLLITSDCGPAHIACLSRVPILIFFGPETPTLFSPLSPRVRILTEDYACSPCVSVYNHRQSPCSNNLCLQSITPETVFTIAEQMIEDVAELNV
jgi:ADP-heptose:LPS heptosyltransferase